MWLQAVRLELWLQQSTPAEGLHQPVKLAGQARVDCNSSKTAHLCVRSPTVYLPLAKWRPSRGNPHRATVLLPPLLDGSAVPPWVP